MCYFGKSRENEVEIQLNFAQKGELIYCKTKHTISVFVSPGWVISGDSTPLSTPVLMTQVLLMLFPQTSNSSVGMKL